MGKVSASLFIEQKLPLLEGIHTDLKGWIGDLKISANIKKDAPLAAIAKEIEQAREELGSALIKLRNNLPKIKRFNL